jgi:hypothetical protein
MDQENVVFTLRLYLTPVRIGIIQNTTNSKCWRGCGGKRNPNPMPVGMQAGATTLKKIWRLLKNLNLDLPYDPAIPLLGIYPKECNTGYSRGTCIPMFIAALFTIARLWKQPRCPLLMNE